MQYETGNELEDWTVDNRGWVKFALVASLMASMAKTVGFGASARPETNGQCFSVSGVIQDLKADGQTVVITHEAIPGYMTAMTMPFKAREPAQLAGRRIGDQISFLFHVTETESWIDQIAKIGQVAAKTAAAAPEPAKSRHPLMDFNFTNELGQAVSLGSFRGQALAITFFFTRCPVPDYCPRLSRNFEEAAAKLLAQSSAPTNWHFLSVSFDTEFDTPAILKAYGEGYHYDARHWSFLTGPADKVAELAALSAVKFDRANGLFNHNFRTLIIDAGGRLQTTFPVGGNLSEAIYSEIFKAVTATNKAALPADIGTEAGHSTN